MSNFFKLTTIQAKTVNIRMDGGVWIDNSAGQRDSYDMAIDLFHHMENSEMPVPFAIRKELTDFYEEIALNSRLPEVDLERCSEIVEELIAEINLILSFPENEAESLQLKFGWHDSESGILGFWHDTQYDE